MSKRSHNRTQAGSPRRHVVEAAHGSHSLGTKSHLADASHSTGKRVIADAINDHGNKFVAAAPSPVFDPTAGSAAQGADGGSVLNPDFSKAAGAQSGAYNASKGSAGGRV